MSRRPRETASDRLQRLLTLVPWLLNRQGVDLAAAADAIGVTPAQIEDDLELLFVCGPPRHGPEDLIDASWEDGRVFLSNADDIARPLRLTIDEAASLMAALTAIAGVPGVDRAVVDRALAKLAEAAGESARTAGTMHVELAEESEAGIVAQANEALDTARRVQLDYVSAGRDRAGTRDVDLLRVVNSGGHWYLEGWCYQAGDRRLFRADRVEALRILDTPSAPPRGAMPADLSRGVYRPTAGAIRVELEIASAAAWFVDYFPVQEVTERADGSLAVTMLVEDPRWLARVVRRFGGAVRVVSPTKVADSVREGAKSALAAYDAP